LLQKEYLTAQRFVAAFGEQGQIAGRPVGQHQGGPGEEGIAGGQGLTPLVGAADLFDGFGGGIAG
jgi:hypothetical protein